MTIMGDFTPGGAGRVRDRFALHDRRDPLRSDHRQRRHGESEPPPRLSFINNVAGAAPALPNLVTLISKTSGGAVTPSGTPAQGASVVIGGATFKLFYNGGDGNNVVLVNAAVPTTVFVDDAWVGLNDGQTTTTDLDPTTGPVEVGIIGVNAFATVQGGVNGVAASGTVKVNAGTYAESVSITGPLTLDGNGGASGTTATAVVIDPTAATAAITISGVAADNVTIQDLRVTGGTDGIAASSVDNLTITNVQADFNTDDGIDLDAITGLGTLSSIVASNNGDDGLEGTSLNTAGSVTIQNSTFNNNGAGTATGDGISIVGAGHVTTDTVIATGNDPGVLISGAASFSDTDGVYSNNDDHGIQLIDIAGLASLIGTTLLNNGGDGLNASGGARCLDHCRRQHPGQPARRPHGRHRRRCQFVRQRYYAKHGGRQQPGWRRHRQRHRPGHDHDWQRRLVLAERRRRRHPHREPHRRTDGDGNYRQQQRGRRPVRRRRRHHGGHLELQLLDQQR